MANPTLAKVSLAAVPLVLPALYQASSFFLSTFFSKRYTVVHDLPNLSVPRPDGQKLKGTAVVCGGSFAGLWSALVLADHFEDVLIVEPEAWLLSEEALSEPREDPLTSPKFPPRSRVFQYSACHALHPLSYHALKRFVPDLDEEVRKAGGTIGRSDFSINIAGSKLKQFNDECHDTFSNTLYLSREAYERLLRRIVVSRAGNIRFMTGTASSVNLLDGDATTISDVVVRLPDGSESIIPASLVVDCTGTTQAGLKWLKRISSELDKNNGTSHFSNIETLRLSYATVQQTRTFRFFIPPEARTKLSIPGGYDNATWLLTMLPKFGKGSKSIYVDRIEGHRMRMMFGSWGDQPLPDFDDIQSFIRSFDEDENVPDWLPTLVDELLEFREYAEVSNCKYPRLSWVRYEKASYLPRNFVAVGDSVMQANPTFGQGLAKVTANTIILDRALRSLGPQFRDSLPSDFSRSYFQDVTRKTAFVWEGAKSVDYLWDTTTPCEGDQHRDYTAFMSKVLLSIFLLGRQDSDVGSKFWKIISFTSSPTSLLAPSIVTKGLKFYMTQGVDFA